MNNKTIINSTLFLIIFLASSCSVTYHSVIDSIVEPRLAIPDEMDTLYLVDRSRFASSYERLKEKLSSGFIVGDRLKKSRNTFKNELKFRTEKPLSIRKKELKHAEKTGLAKPMSKQQIIGLNSPHIGILSIEMFQIYENFQFVEYDKHQLDSLGNDIIIQAIRGKRSNTIECHLRLYEKSNGRILHEIPRIVEHFVEEEGLTESQVRSKLNLNLSDVNIRLATELASELSLEFNPLRIKSHWMYYKGGKLLNPAHELIKNRSYKEAEHYLSEVLNKEKGVGKRQKILYNLCLLHHLQGKKSLAIKMAEEHLQKNKFKALSRLIQQIKSDY